MWFDEDMPLWLTPRKAGMISPTLTLRAEQLDVATLMWLTSQPVMEVVPSPSGLQLYVQAECETMNDLVGDAVPIDARFYILESRRLPNGAKRAHVVLKGQEAPFGWLTQESPDGRSNIRSVYARPLYQVVRLAVVRKRFELTSEEIGTLPIGSKLHIGL